MILPYNHIESKYWQNNLILLDDFVQYVWYQIPEIDENENRVEEKDSWLKKRMFCWLQLTNGRLIIWDVQEIMRY